MSPIFTLSLFYDRALEDLYAPFRPAAVDALRLASGATVLDLPCGTGQNLDIFARAVHPEGRVLGVDSSKGMLEEARKRAARPELGNVVLRHARATDVTPARPT